MKGRKDPTKRRVLSKGRSDRDRGGKISDRLAIGDEKEEARLTGQDRTEKETKKKTVSISAAGFDGVVPAPPFNIQLKERI